jgi:head-tail adaptor
MTPVGLMTTRVLIQQRTASRSTAKAPVESWSSLGYVFMARVKNPSRQDPERFTAGQLSTRQDAVWHMTRRAGMDPDTVNVVRDRRLLYGGRVYDIVQADRIGQAQIALHTIVKADAS